MVLNSGFYRFCHIFFMVTFLLVFWTICPARKMCGGIYSTRNVKFSPFFLRKTEALIDSDHKSRDHFINIQISCKHSTGLHKRYCCNQSDRFIQFECMRNKISWLISNLIYSVSAYFCIG